MLRHTRWRPRRAGLDQRPPGLFSRSAANTLPPLAVWSASDLGLRRRLLPATISHGGPGPTWLASVEGGRGMVPRSMLPVRRDRARALPWRPRHDNPQHFAVAFSSASPGPHRSYADSNAIAVCTADRPASIRFEPTFHSRGFHHWVPHSYAAPSRLPDRGGLTVPTRLFVVGSCGSPKRPSRPGRC